MDLAFPLCPDYRIAAIAHAQSTQNEKSRLFRVDAPATQSLLVCHPTPPPPSKPMQEEAERFDASPGIPERCAHTDHDCSAHAVAAVQRLEGDAAAIENGTSPKPQAVASTPSRSNHPDIADNSGNRSSCAPSNSR
ncbi:hypothetical protein SDC9_148898 [bioreactor metagenome]|uniref:Uncharacterized protein n=1 Tax=bioreactor metagenome TaxID=1076179 RepID=A0A645EIW2_9ZZZZ